MTISRRSLLTSSIVAGAAGTVQAAPAIRRGGPRPVVIASGNGLTARNGGDVSCVELAYRRMTEGEDVLDALIAGVNIVELDPEDSSVGFGGLPDADGEVTLDACCMHGPKKRAGGVACLKGVRTPSLVAKAVADVTDHHLLVDEGAQRFARNLGFTIEDDLNTPNSRALWLEWKRRTDADHYPDPRDRAAAGHRAGLEMVAEGLIDREHYYGTINCNGINAEGHICGVTTTSGLAWKIPGRVGDSPILGAGLYVDNEVGAAGSTGRGEANLYTLASFLVVEFMRQGQTPKDAAVAALQRIASQTVDARLLTEEGRPDFNVNFYVLDRRGNHAGVAFYGGADRRYAVCDENGPRHEPIEAIYGDV
jgi:N4-(beta-N-acetylglucosaminyl)-L-asparaginase